MPIQKSLYFCDSVPNQGELLSPLKKKNDPGNECGGNGGKTPVQLQAAERIRTVP